MSKKTSMSTFGMALSGLISALLQVRQALQAQLARLGLQVRQAPPERPGTLVLLVLPGRVAPLGLKA